MTANKLTKTAKIYEKWIRESLGSISYNLSKMKGVTTQERVDSALGMIAEIVGITMKRGGNFVLEESRDFLSADDLIQILQDISQSKYPKNLGIVFRHPVESVRRLKNITKDPTQKQKKL